MANQSIIIGGKTIPLVTPKADLTPATRQPGGKYHVAPNELPSTRFAPLFGTSLSSSSNDDFIVTDTFHVGTDFGWKAFNSYVQGQRSFWYPEASFNSAWLNLECVIPRVLKTIRLFENYTGLTINSSYLTRYLHVQARNSDQEAWTELHPFTTLIPFPATGTSDYISNLITLTNTVAYKYYRFRIKPTTGHPYVALSSLLLSSLDNIEP